MKLFPVGTKWILPVCGCLLGFFMGCAAPKTSGLAVTTLPDEYGMLESALQVDNSSLAKNLRVVSQKTSITPTGFLRATVEIQSGFNKSRPVQYKFFWMDADGIEVQPDGDAWTPLIIHGKETRQVHGTAPTLNAAGFMLRVREGSVSQSHRWLPTRHNF